MWQDLLSSFAMLEEGTLGDDHDIIHNDNTHNGIIDINQNGLHSSDENILKTSVKNVKQMENETYINDTNKNNNSQLPPITKKKNNYDNNLLSPLLSPVEHQPNSTYLDKFQSNSALNSPFKGDDLSTNYSDIDSSYQASNAPSLYQEIKPYMAHQYSYDGINQKSQN